MDPAVTHASSAVVQLPFSRDEFFDVFVRYNLALWPAVMALWMVTAVLVLSFWNGRLSQSAMSRLLAFHWAWAGVAYHAAFFTQVNPAAWLFAVVFSLEAWLFVRQSSPPALQPTKRVTASGIVGPMLIIYALAYPALNWMQGYTFPRIATFGVPCSTTVLTAGLLVSRYQRLPWSLAAIPIGWSIIAVSAAWLFNVGADWMLPVAGLAVASRALRDWRH